MQIAIFAFNRPDLLQRTLTALVANDLANKASVTFFCDGPRHEMDEPGTQAVRELAKTVQGFATVEVVERPKNMGCAASIIDGLTEMFRLHKRLIVIEDDIVTFPIRCDSFLKGWPAMRTMNRSLISLLGRRRISPKERLSAIPMMSMPSRVSTAGAGHHGVTASRISTGTLRITRTSKIHRSCARPSMQAARI